MTHIITAPISNNNHIIYDIGDLVSNVEWESILTDIFMGRLDIDDDVFEPETIIDTSWEADVSKAEAILEFKSRPEYSFTKEDYIDNFGYLHIE